MAKASYDPNGVNVNGSKYHYHVNHLTWGATAEHAESAFEALSEINRINPKLGNLEWGRMVVDRISQSAQQGFLFVADNTSNVVSNYRGSGVTTFDTNLQFNYRPEYTVNNRLAGHLIMVGADRHLSDIAKVSMHEGIHFDSGQRFGSTYNPFDALPFNQQATAMRQFHQGIEIDRTRYILPSGGSDIFVYPKSEFDRILAKALNEIEPALEMGQVINIAERNYPFLNNGRVNPDLFKGLKSLAPQMDSMAFREALTHAQSRYQAEVFAVMGQHELHYPGFLNQMTPHTAAIAEGVFDPTKSFIQTPGKTIFIPQRNALNNAWSTVDSPLNSGHSLVNYWTPAKKPQSGILTFEANRPARLWSSGLSRVEVQDPRAWAWRSAFSEPRRVPWYQRPNYGAIVRNSGTGLVKCWDTVKKPLGVLGNVAWAGYEIYSDYHEYSQNMTTPYASAFLRGGTKFALKAGYYGGIVAACPPLGVPLVLLAGLAEAAPDMQNLYETESKGLEKVLSDLKADKAGISEMRAAIKDYQMMHPFSNPSVIKSAWMQKVLKGVNAPSKGIDKMFHLAALQDPLYQQHMQERQRQNLLNIHVRMDQLIEQWTKTPALKDSFLQGMQPASASSNLENQFDNIRAGMKLNFSVPFNHVSATHSEFSKSRAEGEMLFANWHNNRTSTMPGTSSSAPGNSTIGHSSSFTGSAEAIFAPASSNKASASGDNTQSSSTQAPDFKKEAMNLKPVSIDDNPSIDSIESQMAELHEENIDQMCQGLKEEQQDLEKLFIYEAFSKENKQEKTEKNQNKEQNKPNYSERIAKCALEIAQAMYRDQQASLVSTQQQLQTKRWIKGVKKELNN